MMELGSPVLCLARSPDGQRVAAATESGLISVAGLADPLDVSCLTGHSGAVLSLSYDPKGEYLASVGADGTARLWNLAKGNMIVLHVAQRATFVDWNPTGTQLAVTTETDVLLVDRDVWTAAKPLLANYPARAFRWSPDGKHAAAAGGKGERAVLIWDMTTRAVVNSLSHHTAIISLSWSPAGTQIALLSEEGKFCSWDATSQAALAKALVPAPPPPLPLSSSLSRTGGAGTQPGAGPQADRVEWDEESYAATQPAFQPNSGDVSQSWHWLAWTHEGLVYVLEWQDAEVHVEFYNRGDFAGFKFPNTLNFTMAAITGGTAVFGSKRNPAQSVSLSSLFFRPCDKLMHDPYNPLPHWVVNMPTGEDIMAVAIGADWAAAATSKQYLRVYSERAVQRAVVALPGPVVTMAGHKKHLAVVYHRTPAVLDRQNLELRLYNIDTEQCEATISLGLGAGTTLRWLGFSWRGMVLVKDSRNVLRGLTRQFGWQWTTVLDFAHAAKEHGASDWWITSVDYEEVRGVAIRGADTQPATFGLMKHPIPVAFTPQLDAIQDKSDKASDEAYVEEVYLRHQAVVQHKKWANQQGYSMPFDTKNDVVDDLLLADAHLLKMMRIALKRGEAARAWDYATLLYFPKSLNIAVKMAEMQRSLKLVDKLLDLLDERKHSFEEERKQAAALEAAAEEEEQEAAPVGFSLDLRKPAAGGHGDQEEEEEEADMDDDTPKPATKKARKSQVEAAPKAAKKTTAQTTKKSASRREAGDHGAAAAAASASSFSFTSVRSESGAVSVRLASRPAAPPVAAPAAVTDHRESPLRADSAAKKKAGPTSNGAAASNATTATKKKTANNKQGAAGKRKRELTQPRLNFAKQQP